MASRMGISVTAVAAAVAILLAVPVGVYFGELPWVWDLTRGGLVDRARDLGALAGPQS